MAKKKGKGKLLLLILPLVIAGAVGGLAFKGIINIPGITPKTIKKKVDPLAAKPEDKKPVGVAKKKVPPTVAAIAPPPSTDPNLGYKKMANVWAEVPVDSLLKIVATYKDNELAPILQKMDDGQVAKLLQAMPPVRAASLSRQIQKVAAVVKPQA